MKFIKKEDHYAVHGTDMRLHYNGTQKFRDDIEAFHATEKGKQMLEKNRLSLIDYNKSSEHRELVDMNGDPYQKLLQRLGRISRYYLSLKKNELRIDKRNWERFIVRGVPKWKKFIKEVGISAIINFIEDYDLTYNDAYDLKEYTKPEYPKQFISKFLVLAREILESGNYLDEESYSSLRDVRGVHGDPRYSTVMSRMRFKSDKEFTKFVKNNHEITSIKIRECKSTPVYCMTVPETGNFMIDDGEGNGICSSNCHIGSLLCGVLFRFLPEMFTRGMVYIAKGAEYVAETPKGRFYGDSLDDIMKKVEPKYHGCIMHVKGWGEINE